MTSAARRPKLGDRRWLACYCDGKALEANAKERGWDPNGDCGPMDYADHGEFETYLLAPNFEAAVKMAAGFHAQDFFGCPRVYLQEFGPEDIEPLARGWEDVKFWDIEPDGTAIEQTI